MFHAVGTGGRAMELMMRQGIIGAVFDYAMGEISDELFHGLRAGAPERLTVAGSLGLPQVIVPGGAEHVGILVSTPHVLPDRWKTHKHVWHNEVVLAPRLNARELRQVAREAGKRLQSTRGNAVLMIPTLGTGRYAMPGGPAERPDRRRDLLRRAEGARAGDHRDRRARGPRRGPGVRRRSRRPPDRARRTAMSAGLGTIRNAQGERLDVSYQPGAGTPPGVPEAIVVIAHGVTAHKDRPLLIALADALSEAGLASLRVSFAGNGASEGRFEDAVPSKEVGDLGSVDRRARRLGRRRRSPTPATAWAGPSA